MNDRHSGLTEDWIRGLAWFAPAAVRYEEPNKAIGKAGMKVLSQ
jgi:hypothetical protein